MIRTVLVHGWGGNPKNDWFPWLKVDVDFEKIKSKANEFIAVFSDNDPFVPLDKNVEFFKKNLNPDFIIKNKMGHFTESDGVKEIQFVLGLIK